MEMGTPTPSERPTQNVKGGRTRRKLSPRSPCLPTTTTHLEGSHGKLKGRRKSVHVDCGRVQPQHPEGGERLGIDRVAVLPISSSTHGGVGGPDQRSSFSQRGKAERALVGRFQRQTIHENCHSLEGRSDGPQRNYGIRKAHPVGHCELPSRQAIVTRSASVSTPSTENIRNARLKDTGSAVGLLRKEMRRSGVRGARG